MESSLTKEQLSRATYELATFLRLPCSNLWRAINETAVFEYQTTVAEAEAVEKVQVLGDWLSGVTGAADPTERSFKTVLTGNGHNVGVTNRSLLHGWDALAEWKLATNTTTNITELQPIGGCVHECLKASEAYATCVEREKELGGYCMEQEEASSLTLIYDGFRRRRLTESLRVESKAAQHSVCSMANHIDITAKGLNPLSNTHIPTLGRVMWLTHDYYFKAPLEADMLHDLLVILEERGYSFETSDTYESLPSEFSPTYLDTNSVYAVMLLTLSVIFALVLIWYGLLTPMAERSGISLSPKLSPLSAVRNALGFHVRSTHIEKWDAQRGTITDKSELTTQSSFVAAGLNASDDGDELDLDDRSSLVASNGGFRTTASMLLPGELSSKPEKRVIGLPGAIPSVDSMSDKEENGMRVCEDLQLAVRKLQAAIASEGGGLDDEAMAAYQAAADAFSSAAAHTVGNEEMQSFLGAKAMHCRLCKEEVRVGDGKFEHGGHTPFSFTIGGTDKAFDTMVYSMLGADDHSGSSSHQSADVYDTLKKQLTQRLKRDRLTAGEKARLTTLVHMHEATKMQAGKDGRSSPHERKGTPETTPNESAFANENPAGVRGMAYPQNPEDGAASNDMSFADVELTRSRYTAVTTTNPRKVSRCV
jgi:hypothetical protein